MAVEYSRTSLPAGDFSKTTEHDTCGDYEARKLSIEMALNCINNNVVVNTVNGSPIVEKSLIPYAEAIYQFLIKPNEQGSPQ